MTARRPATTLRRLLPTSLGGLTGLACALCCTIPLLLAAGILGGAGWAFLGRLLPGIALVLIAATALAWWWARGRPAHTNACAEGNCSCAVSSP
jgi:mercuric ion transport protein